MVQVRYVLATVVLAALAAAVLVPLEARRWPGRMGVRDAGRSHGRFVWSNGGDRIELEHDGDVEFTDDDTDVKSLSPGGYFEISDGGWFGGRGVEVRADAAGRLTRRYRVGIVEKPYEPDGRVWLARTLPRFIRRSGIGAPARVARILKAGGTAGVLSEISRIEGSYGKRIYFTELFRAVPLDAATLRLALAQAAREVTGDYEMASLLIDTQHLVTDDAVRHVYFEAAATIQSGYELRRALSAGLKTGAVPPDTLAAALTTAASIETDYELASLLVEVARRQPLDAAPRRAFFVALEEVGGAYEHRRVLEALAARADLSSELLAAMLESAARIRSDYEQAQFLVKVAKGHTIDDRVRGPFFAAVDTIDSPYEKGRVLETVARRPGLPEETIVAVLRSATMIHANYERSQVLVAVAENQPIAAGPARDTFLQAAERLGEYEQGKAVAALVNNERRRK